jgi:RNA polymerase sigma-70 factor (ECF subfamily)
MTAVAVTGSKVDAEDIVQHAFSIALQKDQAFEDATQFTAWIIVVVRNCALNHRRKCNRRRTFAADTSTMQPIASPTVNQTINPNTGELVPHQFEFDDELISVLNSISSKARRCLLLRTIQELSYKEISSVMGISQGVAMSLVYRSKNKLRAELSQELLCNV